MKNVGKKLRKLRDAKGLTQKDISSQTDVTDEALSQIETGKSNGSLKTFRKLAPVYGMAYEQLLEYLRSDDDIAGSVDLSHESMEHARAAAEKQGITIDEFVARAIEIAIVALQSNAPPHRGEILHNGNTVEAKIHEVKKKKAKPRPKVARRRKATRA